MATPLTYIEAPPRKPRANTSLDVIPVHDVSADHFVGFQFTSDPCSFPNPLPQDCYVTLGPVLGTPKNFGDPSNTVVTKVFGAYQGIECFLNGGIDEFRSVAQRVLEAGEYRVVDGQIAAALMGAAVATTPATATSMSHAIGILESTLAAQVPGQGYIYMSPLAVSIAVEHNLLIRNLDGTLETYLGTPIVVLSEPSVALTLYASGPINLWRTPVTVVDAPAWNINMGRALAERLYSLTIECKSWFITAPPPSNGGGGTTLVLTLGSVPSSPIPDGTDTTLIVNANVAPTDEVFIHYKINGGPEEITPELTEVTPTQFVHNVIGDETGPGDSVELWAVSGTTNSNHIVIDVVAGAGTNMTVTPDPVPNDDIGTFTLTLTSDPGEAPRLWIEHALNPGVWADSGGNFTGGPLIWTMEYFGGAFAPNSTNHARAQLADATIVGGPIQFQVGA